MDIQLIDKTIKELESSKTTFDNCSDLASLYIVRDHYIEQKSNLVESEINDILPSYKKYIQVKQAYQLDRINYSDVLLSMMAMCNELSEMLCAIYSSTDSKQERDLLYNALNNVLQKCA